MPFSVARGRRPQILFLCTQYKQYQQYQLLKPLMAEETWWKTSVPVIPMFRYRMYTSGPNNTVLKEHFSGIPWGGAFQCIAALLFHTIHASLVKVYDRSFIRLLALIRNMLRSFFVWFSYSLLFFVICKYLSVACTLKDLVQITLRHHNT